MSELIALAGDREIARVHMDRGQLSFRYSDGWLSGRSCHFPLSLSMPLASPEHGNRVVSPYLSNLLPDNTDILRRRQAIRCSLQLSICTFGARRLRLRGSEFGKPTRPSTTYLSRCDRQHGPINRVLGKHSLPSAAYIYELFIRRTNGPVVVRCDRSNEDARCAPRGCFN
jgi:HipA-like protein